MLPALFLPKPHVPQGSVLWEWVQLPHIGRMLAAVADNRLCWLGFDDRCEALARAELARAWGHVPMVRRKHPLMDNPGDAPLLVCGTAFQLKVWQALMHIPRGQITSYGAVAQRIGHPGSARAVGTAVGRNPISWRIPCHRVGHSNGNLSGFMWGFDCKKRLLALEHAPAFVGSL